MAIPDVEMELFEMATEKLNDAMDVTNVATAQAAVALDTMLQLQSTERIEMEKLHKAECESMRKHYQRIILAISLTLLLIVGSLIGGLVYIISNYDITFQTYQEVSAEGGGDSTIEDGIRFNQPLNDEAD